MAQLILSTLGEALGRRVAPRAFASAAAALGRSAGSALGASIDQAVFGEARTRNAGRLSDLYLSGSSAGAPIAKVYGRARVAGEIVWAARFKETQTTEETRSGGKGGARVRTTRYRYSLSFAVALCEGPIAGLGRVWANGAPLDLSTVAHRLHRGGPGQDADPLIEAIEGAGNAPAYRGLAYLVFEDLPLEPFGNTVPAVSAEVIAPTGGPDRLEEQARGVCLIPGSGEFVYATSVVRRAVQDGARIPENVHAEAERADIEVALDQLQAQMPGVASVLLVTSWFGDDLRCGHCAIRPGVETATKDTGAVAWRVGPTDRSGARLISQVAGGPAFGGTPDDASLIEAIVACRRRGLKVGLYPFLLMDVPAGNARPDPYGGVEQAAYPWRGRITASIAPGRVGSPDKTAALTGEVAAFFGAASPSHFGAAGGAVTYAGPVEWSFRRFILHYAKLAVLAGGVDSFVMGSELVGLTTLRDGPAGYPAVAALKSLAQDVRALLGPAPVLTYAADWTEYGGHRPTDGSGDVFFHLDPLWADSAISVVGVDWYPPLTDWRDGGGHLDAALTQSAHDPTYLRSRIEAGEAYDWFYASPADRAAQFRTPITDGAYGKPWVFRAKDLRAFWSQEHRHRPGGVEQATPTAWVPQSKPIWLVELGCPAVDKGANAPNLFVDPKSSESAAPPFSTGRRDDLIQRRMLEAYLTHWGASSADNPVSAVDGRRMIDPTGTHLWCWDARPFPAFPTRADVWADGPAWAVGHWLTGRVGAADAGAVIEDLCARAGLDVDASASSGLVPGVVAEGGSAPRGLLAALMELYGLTARVRGGRLRFEPVGADPFAIDAGVWVEDGAPTADQASPDAVPSAVRLRSLDAGLDYRVRESIAVDPSGQGAGGAVTVDAPVVMDEDTAHAFARAALARRRADTSAASLALPPGDLALEPGDLVRLPAEGPGGGVYRVARVTEGDVRRFSLVRHAPWTPPTAGPPPQAAAMAAPATPAFLFLDLPALPGLGEDARPMAAVRGEPWSGPITLYAGSDAMDATRRGEARAAAVFGVTETPLPPGPVGRWDRGTVIRARFPSGDVASVTAGALFAGANAFAVQAPDGVFEILQARRATLVSPGVFELGDLLRAPVGRRPLGLIPAGAAIALLDERPARLDLGAHEAHGTLALFAPPPGRPPSHPGAARLDVVWGEAAKTPPAPVHLRCVSLSNGDARISWVRCARLDADAWGPVEPPQEAEGESYLVEILNGSVVVRSFAVTSPQALYAAAERAADFPGGGAAVVRVRQRGAGGRLGWGRESAL